MSNRFLTYSTGDLTDGSVNVFAASLAASNLTPGLPVKINASQQIESTLLSISDTSGLQTALNSTIQNPLQSDLNCAQYNIKDCKTIDIKTGTHTATLEYTGGSNITLDVALLGADVSYAGGVTSVGQIAVFDATDGKTIKDGLKNIDQVCLTSGFNMEADIDMKGNNIVMGSGLVDGVDVSTLPGDISAKLPLAGGTMSGILNMGGYQTNGVHRLYNADQSSQIYMTEVKGLYMIAGANQIYMTDTKTTLNSPLDAGTHSITTSGLVTDTINEKTLNNGIVIDGVLLKDNKIDLLLGGALNIGDTIATSVVLGASLIPTTINGNLNMVSGKILTTNTINEVTAGAGIDIDGVLIRDGEVRPSSCNVGLHASNSVKLSVWQNGITNIMSWTTSLTECFTPMAIDTIRGYGGGALSIGASTNNAVNIGASGIDTTISGNLVYAQPHIQCYGGVWNANTVANTPMTNTTNLTNIDTNYLINFGTDIKNDMAVGFSFTTAGRITYTGTKTRMVHTAYSLSGIDTKNAICSIAVFKNGAIIQGSVAYIDMTGGSSSTAIHIATMANTNDYFELYARSSVASNVLTIAYVNMFQMVMLN